MINQTVKIDKGLLKLPKELSAPWEGDVFVFPFDDTLVIKKTKSTKSRLSNIAKNDLNDRLTNRQINQEILAYRKSISTNR